MTTVQLNASVKHIVVIGQGLLETVGIHVTQVIRPCRAAIISDSNVFPLYGETVKNSLQNVGFDTVEYVFPAGEQSKNLAQYGKIIDFLAENHISRTDVIIALGGGVVGDMAGFCAATYLRGIRFVQIPTTVLAASDSSVGGKTAVNISAGKNLVGAFWQPSLVVCDTNTFETLDKRQFSCGIAEIIKYGVIRDDELLSELSLESPDISKLITRCVTIKRGIVQNDEKESGERKLLNFGHTIGHAIEKHSNFSLTHGEAVAIGMVMISKLACLLGYADITPTLMPLLEKYNLPSSYNISAEQLIELAANDKKVEGDSLTLVLPKKVGKCVLKKISFSDFSELIMKTLS